MLKKRESLVSFACPLYSTSREDKACVNVCTCDRTALLKNTDNVTNY